jgi:hypothetical protein
MRFVLLILSPPSAFPCVYRDSKTYEGEDTPLESRFANLIYYVEELNYHGTLNGTGPEKGANYGYPECFAAWDPSVIPK